MKQPKWQRARILTGSAKGWVFWVSAEPPKSDSGIGMIAGATQTFDALQTNVRNAKHSKRTTGLILVRASEVELLPEFADDVELIPWEQFLADCKAQKEPQ